MEKADIDARVAALSPVKRALLERKLAQSAVGVNPMRPIPRRSTGAPPPLSFAQQRLWFLSQLEPDSAAYNETTALRLSGQLNVDAIRHALNCVVERHEVLRTTYTSGEDGNPTQTISPAPSVDFAIVELTNTAEAEREIQSEIAARKNQPFDLTRDLPLRVTLLRLANDQHVLVVVKHHIVSDGWSSAVFWRELAAHYARFCDPGCVAPPDLPIQYADYAVWQRQTLVGELLERQLAYWRTQLDGLKPMRLPLDRARAVVPDYSGAREVAVCPSELLTRLKGLSREQGVTLFMTLLGAFQVLLQRYTAQDDVAVGTPIAGRTRPELEGLIGFFVNTLVLRADLSGDPSFVELLARVRDVALQAYEHQDLPFEKLVEELNPERGRSQTPLFQVMFAVQNAPRSGLEIGGVNAAPIEVDAVTAKFDLFAAFVEREGDLSLRIEYRTELFDATTIRRMLGHCQVLLESIAANPHARISELPFLTQAERQQLLWEWNNTAADYPKDQCVQQIFEKQAAQTPHAIALALGQRTMSYGELNSRANKLARYLSQLGVAPGARVAIALERSFELTIGLLGILKAGAAYVPLDPKYPKERVRLIVQDVDARVVLIQEKFLALFEAPTHNESDAAIEDPKPVLSGVEASQIQNSQAPDPTIQNCRVIALDRDWPEIEEESADNLACESAPGDRAYIMYTSGSTGAPKGVEISHRAIARLIFGGGYAQLDADQVLLQLAPTAFDASTFEIWGALLHGGKSVIAPNELPGASELGALLRKHAVSTLWLTASLFNAVIDTAPEALSGIKQLLIGGEALSVTHVRRALELLSETQIINGYGPTESTTFACCYPIARALGENVNSLPIGKPIGNTKVYILNAHMNLAPIGVAGELYIGGDGLARGYLNDPKLTASKFIMHTFAGESEQRLYRTGDLARYLLDGNIEFLGRIDDQVKIRGYRIEPGEIETALREHPGVQAAAVLAREEPVGDKRLVAYVVFDPASGATTVQLRESLQQRLPDYMMPSAFVILDHLPLMSNGKVDRKALPAPDYNRSEAVDGYQPARTTTEEILAAIWADVLNLAGAGIHDNFFELGGHSLLATQVVSRIHSAMTVQVPLREMFDHPTLAGLAECVDRARREQQQVPALPIHPVSRSEPLPLSFAQQRLWFLDQLEPESSVYNVPSVFRIKGPLDSSVLQRAINEVVRRHEALRTTFGAHDGEAVQHISDARSLDLPLIDLSEELAETREEKARRLAAEESRRPFDLARGPLVRAKLIRLNEQDFIFALTMHHIVSDGWSIGIIFRELSTLYAAFSKGESSPFSDLPIQYADFAVCQRQWLEGPVLEAQLAYWKERLGGVPSLDLPSDRSRPATQNYRGAREPIEISGELSEALKILSRRHNATLFMTLMAAFQTLLWRYSGQEEFALGSPIANRNFKEIESLVGFFVNTLVFKADLSGDPSFAQLLARAREATLGAYDHQDLPFEKLVEALEPQRVLNENPLFDCMFILQSAPNAGFEGAGLDVDLIRTENPTAKFDLTLSLRESSQGLTGTMEYSTDLYERATIRRMLDHFQILIQSIVENPQARISELRILGDSERHQLLVDWNDTAREYPRDKTVHELFEVHAREAADAVALVCADQRLTYRRLNERANRLAHYLREHGIAAQARVAICADRSLDLVVGILGILKAGAAYVPLDPNYPAERLRFILDDTQAAVLLTQEKFLPSFTKPPELRNSDPTIQNPKPKSENLQVVCLDRDWPDIQKESSDNLHTEVSPSDLAYIMYTSGSTGKPKGVEIPHRAIVRLLFGTDYAQFGAQQVFMHLAPTAFDASTFEIWGALLHRGKCVLCGSAVPSLQELSDLITKHRVTTLWLTASLFNTAIEIAPEVLAGLEELLIGGEALSLDHVKRALELLPKTAIINGYGPTECTTFSCCYPIARSLDPEARSVPIGKPIGNTRVYILDRTMSPVPIGVAGELYIGGDGLARGYLNDAELTASKFITHSFDGEPEQRLYRSGDLARYLPDGNIEFFGRIDDQVKIRGYRIEPAEIEAALRQHPAVREGCVVARRQPAQVSENPKSQMQNPRSAATHLVAYAVGQPPSAVTAAELRDFLKEKLPEYMIPSAFVFLDALPLTAAGKIDRKALPHPDASALAEQRDYVAPRTATERWLTPIWAEMLGVERIGVDDNFFELGGHSLLIVRLCARIKKLSGKDIPLAALFRAPTIAQFARLYDSDSRLPAASTVVPIRSSGSWTPFFCVHGAWGSVVFGAELARYLSPHQPFYGLQAPGLEGEQEPFTRIEDMAAHHVREIRRIQPEGPYCLGGLSLGGLIAYEIAQQLIAQRQPVELVVLIDTYRATRHRSLWSWRRRARRYLIEDLVGRLIFHGRNIMEQGRMRRAAYAREKTRLLGKKVAAKLRVDHQANEAHLGDSYAVKVRKANIQAMQEYEPRPYAGRVALLMTSESPQGLDGRSVWRELALGGLDTYVVPGDHRTMLSEAHIGATAEKLRECIETAHRGFVSPQSVALLREKEVASPR